MRLRVVLAFVLLATTASLALAQITSATLSGTIKDETGGVLPGVDVVIRNLDTGLTRSVVTDSNGYFAVPGLAPGTYEARATLRALPPQCKAASSWVLRPTPSTAGIQAFLDGVEAWTRLRPATGEIEFSIEESA